MREKIGFGVRFFVDYAGCKVYFLKRLFVVPLPYHSFLVWLRNLDKKHRSRNS